MANAALGTVLRRLHTLAGASPCAGVTDRELLRRFAAERDADAFGELLRRHGPLVLGVCRRVLGQEQDAEDASQAAFLVLARKAAAIRKGESVGSFLYGVAYRIAMRERTRLYQRRRRERRAGTPTPTGPVYEAAFRELQAVLDGGLNQLAEKYRAPFVLCCLEGKSKGEAARELGWKEGTVSSRLAHARSELQRLLARKGVALTAALAAAAVADNTAGASVPAALAAAQVRAAVLFASGSSLVGKEAAPAVQMAEAMLRSMAVLSWKATVLFLIACLAMGGAGLALSPQEASSPQESKSPQAAPKAPPRPEERAKVRRDRYGDPLPEGALARLGTLRFRQGFMVYSVAFSPDGKTVACGGAGRGLGLWDVATGKELRQLDQPGQILGVAFSPDGKLLASTGNGRPVLFDVATGAVVRPLQGANMMLSSLVFAPDGKTLAGQGDSPQNRQGAVFLFDVATGQKRKELPVGEAGATCVAFSPDGKLLLVGGKDKAVHLWDAVRITELGRLTGHAKAVSAVAASPDGKTVASASGDQTIRLWDLATRKEKHVFEVKHEIRTVLFAPGGRLLASGHADGTITLWDVNTGKEVRCWQAHTFPIRSLDFAPDGRTLISGAIWEAGPRLWDVATGKDVHSFPGHTSSVDQLQYSRDGKHLFSLGREKQILDWDLASRRARVHFGLPSHTRPRALDQYTLSPRGDLVASWSHKDDSVRLWDVATVKERYRLGKLANRRETFLGPQVFSPDGRLLACAGTAERGIDVFDTASGSLRFRFKGLEGEVNGLAFSRDGKRLAAGSSPVKGKPTIALWDAATGARLGEAASFENVDTLAFSPDGTLLASASWGGRPDTLCLWDAATGRPLRRFPGAPALYGVVFSPDGKWLAGAGTDMDKIVHVWEVSTGLEVRSFRGHITGVLSVAFAPDGLSLASGGGDSMVMLWDFTGRRKDGRRQTVQWTQAELDQRWRDLASRDGPRAVQALWDLADSPEQTVPLLCRRLGKAQQPDAERIQRLIRDLDSSDFQTRTAATKELEAIVDQAEPALRKALDEGPHLEARRRIEQVLQRLEPLASPERLRALRAVSVLEYAGTSEARQLLRDLAGGTAGARLSREAKTALERMPQS